MLLVSTGCSEEKPSAYILDCDNLPEVELGYKHENDKEIPGIYKIHAFRIDGLASGTAFTIQHNKKTYLVTAAHVMDRSYGVLLRYKGRGISFRMIEGRQRSDVIVFRVEGYFPGHLKVDKLFYQKFESYEVYGYAGGKSLVKMKCALSPDFGYLNSSAFVEKGMSGGPLMKNGRVVGVTVAKLIEKSGMTYSRHIPISLVRKLIDQLP